jgi:NTP pyrophosphatase (non-canonical NTP hydrolase)
MTDEQKDAINKVAVDMYNIAASKGFHDKDTSPVSVERMAMYCANLHGEVSELWEAARKGKLDKPCDKDCGLTCAEEELADIAIRVMDTAAAILVDLGKAIDKKASYNQGRERMHGKVA